jgi:hypothetical protein
MSRSVKAVLAVRNVSLNLVLEWADADGRLTGPDAVKFFSLSQLPRSELKKVCCPF